MSSLDATLKWRSNDITKKRRQHLEIAESTWNRRLAQYGGIKVSDVERLMEFEGENARLTGLLADAELDKDMLREIAWGTSDPEPHASSGDDAARPVWGVRTTSVHCGRDPSLHASARIAAAVTAQEAELRAWLRKFSHDRPWWGLAPGSEDCLHGSGSKLNDKRIRRLWA